MRKTSSMVLHRHNLTRFISFHFISFIILHKMRLTPSSLGAGLLRTLRRAATCPWRTFPSIAQKMSSALCVGVQITPSQSSIRWSCGRFSDSPFFAFFEISQIAAGKLGRERARDNDNLMKEAGEVWEGRVQLSEAIGQGLGRDIGDETHTHTHTEQEIVGN